MTASWNNVRQALAAKVDDMDYKVWIAPVDGEIRDRTVRLRLSGGSGYMAERLEKKLGALIREEVALGLGCTASEVVLDIRPMDAARDVAKEAARDVPLDVPMDAASASSRMTSDRMASDRMASEQGTGHGSFPAPVISCDAAAASGDGLASAAGQPRTSQDFREDVNRASGMAAQPADALPEKPGASAPSTGDGARASRQMNALPLVHSMSLGQAITPSGERLNRSLNQNGGAGCKWRYSFDDFVVGDSNRMAATAAYDMCRPHSYAETLFVSSATGLGKTHIIQSAVRELLNTRGSDARVAYLTADEFYSRYMIALNTKSLESFSDKVRALDFLLMEDVQFLNGKVKTQEHLLGLVKHLKNKGSKVVFSSRYQTKELKDIDPALVSFLGSGLQTSMDAPDYEMRCEIVRRKARASDVYLSEEVVDILAASLEGDVRRIESCLQTIFLKARVEGVKPDPKLAREVLAELVEKKEPARLVSFDDLLSFTSQCCGLTAGQICSCIRRRPFVEARNVLCYLARKHTSLTLEQIGARVNKRHSTVIKGIASVEHNLTLETQTGRQTARLVELIEKNAGIVPARAASASGTSGTASASRASRASEK